MLTDVECPGIPTFHLSSTLFFPCFISCRQPTTHSETPHSSDFVFLRDVFVHLDHGQPFDDHVATFLVTVYALIEGGLVNYVVPDAFQSTTQSDDTRLMRFCCLRWHFMCLCNFWGCIRPQISHRYTGGGSGCETEYVRGTCEDLNPT
jgi:hypothetical protein